MSGLTSTHASFHNLLTLSDEELAKYDVAEINLVCASGLPGTESTDIKAYQSLLDRWAEQVYYKTQRCRWFLESPEKYNHSFNLFRIHVMISVLQRDFGVHYNPRCIPEDAVFEPKDSFIHGILQGTGGTWVESREGINYYIASATQEFPFAQEILGDIYSGELNLSGDVAEKFTDYSEAVKWYRKAAEKGFPIACHRLGEMYATGKGANKDETEALKWYQKGAEQEYQPSQEIIAQAYLKGLLGLPKDREKAQYWLEKAKVNQQ